MVPLAADVVGVLNVRPPSCRCRRRRAPRPRRLRLCGRFTAKTVGSLSQRSSGGIVTTPFAFCLLPPLSHTRRAVSMRNFSFCWRIVSCLTRNFVPGGIFSRRLAAFCSMQHNILRRQQNFSGRCCNKKHSACLAKRRSFAFWHKKSQPYKKLAIFLSVLPVLQAKSSVCAPATCLSRSRTGRRASGSWSSGRSLTPFVVPRWRAVS